jgi:hypothetical protein
VGQSETRNMVKGQGQEGVFKQVTQRGLGSQ